MLILRSLTLKNIATISDTALEFDTGLNVLTGETGSGKSILVDGLMLATGARAEKSLVRPGTKTASVEAVFQKSEGEEIVVRREISAQGRSRVFLDDALTTLEDVRKAVQDMVALHSQRSTPALFKPAVQMDLLDRFAGSISLLEKYKNHYREWQGATEKGRELRDFLGESGSSHELLVHEISLFDEIDPSIEDYESLQQDRGKVHKALNQSSLFQETLDALQGDEGVASALSGVLSRMQKEAPEREELNTLFTQASISIDEAVNLVRSLIIDIDDAPGRISRIDNRLDEYSRLIARSGGTIHGMLEQRKSLTAQLEEYEAAKMELAVIDRLLPELSTKVTAAANLLSAKRKKAGKKLAEETVIELKDLNIPMAQFSLQFSKPASFVLVDGKTLGSSGAESVLFVFSANPGIPEDSLENVASGGELSRVALSLALVLADSASASASASTLIFDEIDAGTGGETAHCLAKSLLRAAESRQIIVISHLAQIASRADRHLAVTKEFSGGMPSTVVKVLDSRTERLNELARLLGGGSGAFDHASSLLGGTS